MFNYELFSEEKRSKYAPELVGQKHVVVSDGEKLWVVKHKPGSTDEEKRDRLGYLLGRKLANVAEVKLLNKQEHIQIRTLAGKESSNVDNTFLVRLGGSYSIEELSCKTLDQAVATELVYSTWIRRRDTHANNCVYTEGIPIFFDHQTAFLGQSELADISTFFSEPATEGHACNWRVRETQGDKTTIKARQGNIDHHYINSLETFRKQINAANFALKNSLKRGWEDLISEAGFDSSKKRRLLTFSKETLRPSTQT